MRSPRPGVAVAAAAALLLVGCASSPSEEFTVLTADETTALVATHDGEGMEAQIAGTVARTSDGCLAIDDGSNLVPIVWPRGTQLDGADVVVLPSGDRVTIGDEVAGGGGEVATNSLTASLPEACGESTRVLLADEVRPAQA